MLCEKIKSEVKKIRFLELAVECEITKDGYLPKNLGSAFRGAFGYALKAVVCALRQSGCDGCILYSSCIYIKIFRSPAGSSAAFKNRTFAPHPYFITPPANFLYGQGGDKPVQKVKKKEILKVGLTIIGGHTEYTPYYIYTLIRIGEHGMGKEKITYRIKDIYAVKDEREEKVFADGRLVKEMPPPSCIKSCNGKENSAFTLHFKTPVKLKAENRLVRSDMKFHHIIRAILRRMSALACYTKEEIDLPFKDIISQAEDIKTRSIDLTWVDLMERKAVSSSAMMTIGGLIGTITFTEGIKPFIPLVKLGESLRIGKDVSFGCGRYMLEEGGAQR